jgi:septal ring-binding cell division protein DamX
MLIDPRCIILTLAFVLAGCTTKATSPNQAQQRSASDEETSWHCEQGTSTWSCKRLTIAEIQQREADRRNKRFDWSLPPAKSTPEQLEAPQEKSAVISAQQAAVSLPPAASPIEPSAHAQESATSASLQDLPGDFWAVQLIALNSQTQLRDFMQSTQLDELTGAMIKVNGRTWYVALLGIYENRDLAEQAAAQRPMALQRYEPYVRSVASLQAVMIAADPL